MKFEFSPQISGKSKNAKFYVLSFSMRTDGHVEANGRFSRFCESAYKPDI